MSRATRRAGLAGTLVVLGGLGMAACGGGTTNAVRSGTTPYGATASKVGPVSSAEPPPATIGGHPWFSGSTSATSKGSSTGATVVHVTIESVKTPQGSEPAYVGPSGTVGAPSLFSVKAHAQVEVVVDNHDTGPHTFTAPSLGLNVTIGPDATVTFSFDAPGAGTYTWYCEVPCGSWVMSHVGYMKGKVTVVS